MDARPSEPRSGDASAACRRSRAGRCRPVARRSHRRRRIREPYWRRVELDLPAAFAPLGLSLPVMRAIAAMGYTKPMPIQEEVVPLMMARKDVVGQAQTGTGKTAAFGIPIAELVDPALNEVQAVVLTPTRELAQQITREMQRLTQYRGVRVLPVYGGENMNRQLIELERGVQVVIGTPGRVLDHLGRGTLQLDHVRMAILDEADEMLDIGFADDMETILRYTPSTRQTALFSATMPPFIQRMIRKYLRDPQYVRIDPEKPTVAGIQQRYYEVAERDKTDGLAVILEEEGPGARVLIFRRTQMGVDHLARMLQRRGFPIAALHGGMAQGERNRVMTGFRNGDLRLVVATNVAARGIDIPDITHVVNFDMPDTVEEDIHRIGRTGRAGKLGVAISFIAEWDFAFLQALDETMPGLVERWRLPIY
ncbi:MAG: DEAD/DEAH box helicase [Chloroflexi bacterium]|nr:DEAD/DEAH box helicase [Chloroflexota bacterium]